MPRDGSGNYTLPAGNPVISGTTIDVAWANPTMSDVATALTDSLSRTGSGGMLVPFLNADGAVGSPGISWVNEPTSGLYRAGLNDQRFSSSGVDVLQLTNDANNPLRVFSNGMFSDVVNADLDRTIAAAWTFSNRLVTDDSTSSRAGLNIPPGVAPSAPVNGDIWVDGTSIFARVNGITENLTGSTIVAAGTVVGNALRWNGTGWEETDSIQFTSGPSRILNTRETRFSSNVNFQTASSSDYMWFTGFNNIYSIVAQGIVDQLTFSGWDFLELDGPSLKIWGQASAPAGNEAGYSQFWVRNDTIPVLIHQLGDGTELPIYERGSFTLNWSVGFSDSNVNTYQYMRIGNFVHAWQPASNLGNSNATDMSTSDGVPVALRPTTTRYCGVGSFVDNASVIVMAQLRLDTDGTLHAFAGDGLSPTGFGDNWTASGVKGPNGGLSFSWNIDD